MSDNYVEKWLVVSGLCGVLALDAFKKNNLLAEDTRRMSIIFMYTLLADVTGVNSTSFYGFLGTYSAGNMLTNLIRSRTSAAATSDNSTSSTDNLDMLQTDNNNQPTQ